MYWSNLPQDRDQWKALVMTVPYMTGNSSVARRPMASKGFSSMELARFEVLKAVTLKSKTSNRILSTHCFLLQSRKVSQASSKQ
jgi:hypothetical protein